MFHKNSGNTDVGEADRAETATNKECLFRLDMVAISIMSALESKRQRGPVAQTKQINTQTKMCVSKES